MMAAQPHSPQSVFAKHLELWTQLKGMPSHLQGSGANAPSHSVLPSWICPPGSLSNPQEFPLSWCEQIEIHELRVCIVHHAIERAFWLGEPLVVTGFAGRIQEMSSWQPPSHPHTPWNTGGCCRQTLTTQVSRSSVQMHLTLRIQLVNI